MATLLYIYIIIKLYTHTYMTLKTSEEKRKEIDYMPCICIGEKLIYFHAKTEGCGYGA